MKIEFSIEENNLLKCLETCIYYKTCFQRIENDGIIGTNHSYDFGRTWGCPMFGSMIAPKFEECSVVSCEDICPSRTWYHCRHCSASMPIDKCDMMKHGRPTEDCPVYGMPSGKYEIEISDENFVLVSKPGEDCLECKNFVDEKCGLYEYDFRDRYCEKLEKKNEDN